MAPASSNLSLKLLGGLLLLALLQLSTLPGPSRAQDEEKPVKTDPFHPPLRPVLPTPLRPPPIKSPFHPVPIKPPSPIRYRFLVVCVNPVKKFGYCRWLCGSIVCVQRVRYSFAWSTEKAAQSPLPAGEEGDDEDVTPVPEPEPEGDTWVEPDTAEKGAEDVPEPDPEAEDGTSEEKRIGFPPVRKCCFCFAGIRICLVSGVSGSSSCRRCGRLSVCFGRCL